MSKSQSKALAVVSPDIANDVEMGRQLTAQSAKVDAAMTDVLVFGVMVWMVEDRLAGTGESKGGRGNEGGISGWLRKYAPSVSKQKASRYRDVAKSVASGFKLPPKVTFITLATTPPAALSPKLRRKQQELFAYVAGTSPNSWLDQFKAIKAGGGSQESQQPQLTDAEAFKLAVQQIREDHRSALDVLGSLTGRKAFQALPDNELHAAIDTAETFVKQARAWAATPKTKRTPSFKP